MISRRVAAVLAASRGFESLLLPLLLPLESHVPVAARPVDISTAGTPASAAAASTSPSFA
jgi:hypothetical protein